MLGGPVSDETLKPSPTFAEASSWAYALLDHPLTRATAPSGNNRFGKDHIDMDMENSPYSFFPEPQPRRFGCLLYITSCLSVRTSR